MRPIRLIRPIIAAVCASAPLHAATPEEGIAFFEKRIRPLLEEHCYECHSAKSKKLKGGLLLDSREGWTKGGESGPAIVPGKPDDSLLIRGVRYWDKEFQMPPEHPLPPERVTDLIEWVKLGAPDPREGGSAGAKAASGIDYEKGLKHWAFQPVQTQQRPAVKDDAWPRNDVDYFISHAWSRRASHLRPMPTRAPSSAA